MYRQGLNAEERTMIPDVSKTDVVKELNARLRRIEGQARGVQRMIEEDRECEEVVMQLSAMRAAINKVAFTVMSFYLEECLQRTGMEKEEAMRKARLIFKKFG